MIRPASSSFYKSLVDKEPEQMMVPSRLSASTRKGTAGNETNRCKQMDTLAGTWQAMGQDILGPGAAAAVPTNRLLRSGVFYGIE